MILNSNIKDGYGRILRQHSTAGMWRCVRAGACGGDPMDDSSPKSLELSQLLDFPTRDPAGHAPMRSLILAGGFEERVVTLGRSRAEPSSFAAAHRIKPRRK